MHPQIKISIKNSKPSIDSNSNILKALNSKSMIIMDQMIQASHDIMGNHL